MGIDGIVWRDEELMPVETAGGADYEPRYSILDREGRVVVEGAKLRLSNQVRVAGTSHNADNMNMLMQKGDCVGSFFYRPLGDVRMHKFAHEVQAGSWHELPQCPVDLGRDAVAVCFEGKYYVTLGRVGDILKHDVAIYDIGEMSWEIREAERGRDVNLGGVEDHRVVGDKLFVVCKDYNGTAAATAWIDCLDLKELTWTYGSVNTWPAHIRSIGPLRLLTDGTGGISAGRDGSQGNNMLERFTAATTAPALGGMLPFVNNAGLYVPAGFSIFNGQHVLNTFTGEIFRATTLMGWVAIAHPAATRHLMPVTVSGGEAGAGLIYGCGAGNSNIFCLNSNFQFSVHNTGGMLNFRMMAVFGGRCYFMRSGQTGAWEPSVNWGMFDIGTGAIADLPNAPETLGGFALCASDRGLFAVKGNRAFLGHFEVMSEGVMLGRIFKGLSVAATGNVFLCNEKRTVVVEQGGWHEADDDYVICAAPGMQIFGQVANI